MIANRYKKQYLRRMAARMFWLSRTMTTDYGKAFTTGQFEAYRDAAQTIYGDWNEKY